MKAIKTSTSSHQVCYDVMVTFDMFPHADSLEREKERERGRQRERKQLLCQCMYLDKPGSMEDSKLIYEPSS